MELAIKSASLHRFLMESQLVATPLSVLTVSSNGAQRNSLEKEMFFKKEVANPGSQIIFELEHKDPELGMLVECDYIYDVMEYDDFAVRAVFKEMEVSNPENKE